MTPKRISLALAIAVVTVLLFPATAMAISDPDTPPQILSVIVYEDCYETGDVGVLVEYYLDYAVLPTETVTEAYLVVFLDTDGATQLKTTAPYTLIDNGYGYGLAWIRFTPAQVSTYGIDSANQALYQVRLIGNPLVPSGWAGAPPSVSVSIDTWHTTGDTSVLIALRVLYYADRLAALWGIPGDLLQTTPLGNKLSTLGETYFTNVVTWLRQIAPNAFASGSMDPIDPGLDFTQSFGATMTDITGTVTGSPITLLSGENTVTITVAGTFDLTLDQGTIGTVEDGTGAVVGSPVDLVAGSQTITVLPGDEGTLVVDVWLSTVQTTIEDSVVGTGFDLTDLAVRFGMSRMWASSIVWFIVSILVCAAVYKKGSENSPTGASKVTFLIFNIMFVGGILLAMLPMIGGILLFLACDLFIGYVVFFRPANV
jgi:hypothetical protein